MIILGRSNNESYIVQIHENELANLLNFYSRYDKDFLKMVKVGDEIDVSELYKDARKLEELHDKVEEFRTFFVDMADVMRKHVLSRKDSEAQC